MPTQRILDASGGVVTTIETDELQGKTIIGRYQDTAPIIEHNKKLAALDQYYNADKDLRRVASVPCIILEKWCKEDGIPIREFMRHPRKYSKWLRRKLYDSDNRFFLTAPHKA